MTRSVDDEVSARRVAIAISVALGLWTAGEFVTGVGFSKGPTEPALHLHEQLKIALRVGIAVAFAVSLLRIWVASLHDVFVGTLALATLLGAVVTFRAWEASGMFVARAVARIGQERGFSDAQQDVAFLGARIGYVFSDGLPSLNLLGCAIAAAFSREPRAGTRKLS